MGPSWHEVVAQVLHIDQDRAEAGLVSLSTSLPSTKRLTSDVATAGRPCAPDSEPEYPRVGCRVLVRYDHPTRWYEGTVGTVFDERQLHVIYDSPTEHAEDLVDYPADAVKLTALDSGVRKQWAQKAS